MAKLKEHLEEAGFQMGLDEGMWGLVNEDQAFASWPYVFIWIAAREKPGCPNKYHFRIDVSGYPAAAPTACPWDMEKDARLASEKWPKGGLTVSSVFNPGWNPNALYAPCDRLAMPGHDWRREFPDYWWSPSSRIEKYLHFLHTRLQSKDYVRS